MKIAIDFKENRKEKILQDLKNRNYKIDTNSFMTTWIYDLAPISYQGKSISIEKKDSYDTYKIYLDDIEYFEVHE